MMRAVYLEAEFRGLVQGDLTVTAYCHRLKALSDALRDIGTPVSDQTLVLNCLRGLNARFADITTIVTMQNPLPSFGQTRSLLTLRETQLANSAKVGAQTALYGAAPSHGAGSSNGGHAGGSNVGHAGGSNSSGNYRGGNGNGNGNWRRKKNNGGNRNGNSNGNIANAPRGPWVYFNPHTGQAQQMQAPPAMRPNPSAGLLGAPPPGPRASARPGLRLRPTSDPRLHERPILGLLRSHGCPEQRSQHLCRSIHQRWRVGQGLWSNDTHGLRPWYAYTSYSLSFVVSCHRGQWFHVAHIPCRPCLYSSFHSQPYSFQCLSST